MESLPTEITTNILLRLPVKSSGQGRCVCKLWYEILCDPIFPFIQFKQISTSLITSPDILLHHMFPLKIYYLQDNDNNNEQQLRMFNPLIINDSCHDLSLFLGSCHGLICITKFDVYHHPCNPISVFNPITHESSKLPPYTLPQNQSSIGFRSLVGFGFQDSKQEFKVVLVMLSKQDDNTAYPQLVINEVQIYTLGSTNWISKAGIVPEVLSQAITRSSSAFVSGCLHWTTNGVPPIVSFDLGTEEFGFVPTPLSHLLEQPYNLGVLEGNLSVVECSHEFDIHIWVMKKYNVKESWVRQFTIPQDLMFHGGLRCCFVEILIFRKNGELLLLCNGNDIFSYNITSQKIRSVEFEGVEGRVKPFLRGQPFVGSLISLKSVSGMDSDAKET